MILVTGAAGLLGRELLAQLAAQGAACRGVDRNDVGAGAFERIQGDLRDWQVCAQACVGVKALVHAAAVQHHSGVPRWGREAFFLANVRMTEPLVAAAIAAGVRQIVLVSSDMVYGMPIKTPVPETHTPRPIGPYGRSKLASEGVCLQARAAGVCVTILRPRLIVGPGRLGVLKRLFDRIRENLPVPMLGRGENRYQMVAVSDVASACRCALQRMRDGVFNLGSQDPPPVRELLGELIRRARSTSSLRVLPASLANAGLWALHSVRLAPLVPEQFRIASVDYVLDTRRAQEQLGWQPQQNDLEMLWQAYQTYAQPA